MADEDDSQDNLRKALTFMGTAEFLPVIDLMDSMDSTGFHTVQPPSTPTSALLVFAFQVAELSSAALAQLERYALEGLKVDPASSLEMAMGSSDGG